MVAAAPGLTHGPAWYLSLIRRIGGARWFTWLGAHILTRLDRWLYPRFHGRLISAGPPILPLLLLTTTGRKTGRPSSTPLLYLPDGEDLVVVGSNWGQRRHPRWSSNLLAEPHASVQISGRRRTIVARLVTPEQHARLWPKLVEEFPPYQTYANRSGREPRIFVLSSDVPIQ